MRILTLVERLTRGGTERAAEVFSRCYQDAGHQVMVMAWSRGGVREEALERAGIEVVVVGDDPDLEAALVRADAFNPDVIHIHRASMPSEEEYAMMRRLKTGRRKVIETSVFGRYDSSRSGVLVDVHMQLTEWCMWRWRKWAWPGGRSKSAAVVANPVECSAFERASEADIKAFRREVIGVPDDAFVLGRIGQKMDGKWHPATIDAFADLARDDPRVYLATIGMPPSCEQRLAQLPPDIRKRAITLAYIDGDRKLAAAFSSFDIFLHAAQIGETFGYVLAEAMLCECPVATVSRPHKDNSQIEVVGHGVGGVVAGSFAGLPAACRRLYGDEEFRRRLGRQGRQRILERYDAPLVAGLALRVAKHAVEALGSADLSRRLREDAGLVTDVSGRGVKGLLDELDDRPAFKEELLRRVVTFPGVYRLYTLARSLSRK